MNTHIPDDEIPLIWRYAGGKWEQIPDPLYKQVGPPNVYDDWLEDSGFIHVDRWCGDHPVVHVYEREAAPDRDMWRIEFAMEAAHFHKIMVPALPDLVELLAKLGVIALASERGEQVPGMRTKQHPPA